MAGPFLFIVCLLQGNLKKEYRVSRHCACLLFSLFMVWGGGNPPDYFEGTVADLRGPWRFHLMRTHLSVFRGIIFAFINFC